MYTKVFKGMYEGTLADNWQALVTFQQLLILATEDGVVDMTIGAIHRVTNIPIEILEAGIKVLEAPDTGSRTPDMEGRRIARLDEHRNWGWFLVNFRKYRQMTSREEKKEADRQRMEGKRNAEKAKDSNNVASSRGESQEVASARQLSLVSQSVAEVAHTEAEEEVKQEHARPKNRFEEFWSAYPCKKGRADAEAKWKAKGYDSIADRILADVAARKTGDRQWLEGYVPHGSTYVNGRGWEDAIEPPRGARTQHSTGAPSATDVDYAMAVGK